MITITGGSFVQITCTTDAEVQAIARACRVISIGREMTAKCNRAERRRIDEIAAKFNAPRGAASANAAERSHRILVGVSDMGTASAPETVNINGETLAFSGYGKIFSVNPADNSASGLEPHFERACYAYYR